MAGIEELLVSIVSKFDDAGFKALDRSTAKSNKATAMLSNSLRGLFVGVIGTIGAREIVNATVKLDSLTTSMNALAGSQEAGAAQMKFLREETNRLGQDFMTTAEAYKNLFSSGKGAGMADSDIQSIFSGVLEAGTVLGSSQQQMQGAITAIEQMISKGKVASQELRLQLSNSLPGAMQIAARAMGVTNQEFQKMLESGLDSQKFVMAFANQLHTEFAGKATDASHTLRAELARLQNSVFNLETSLLDGEAGKEFGELVAQVTKLLSSSAFKQSLKLVSQLLTVILKNIRLIGGIAAIMGIRRLIQTVAMLRLEFLTTTFAAGSLQAALQMDAGIASIKALTKASWGLLAPWAKLILILGLVIEAIDTLRGKKTLTSELALKNPLAKSATQFAEKNRDEHPFLSSFAEFLANGRSYGASATILGAHYGKNLTKDLKNIPQRGAVYNNTNNQNAFTFNIKSDEPKAVANEVKATMLNIFTNFGTGKGFPQGAR